MNNSNPNPLRNMPRKKLVKLCQSLGLQVGRNKNDSELRAMIQEHQSRPIKRKIEPEEPEGKPRGPPRMDLRFRHQDVDACQEAMEKKRILPDFNLAEFTEARNAGKVKLRDGKPWKDCEPIRLCREDGPTVLLDNEGHIVFLYLPNFIYESTKKKLLDRAHGLMEVQAPKWDDVKHGDSRAGPSHGKDESSGVGQTEDQGSQEPAWLRRSARLLAKALPSLDLFSISVPNTLSEQISDSDSLDGSDDDEIDCLVERGQHTVKPIQLSSELKHKLDDPDVGNVKMQTFAWKSPLDTRINNVVKWWFPQFHGLLTSCKEEVIKSVQPPAELLQKWQSDFSHLAIGINRTTHKHRDCGGVTHGIDFLLLTGNMTSGGELYLQDLNLTVEWKPGAACAFDGKLFTHEVLEWDGDSRVCFIYFAKRNVFEHFDLPLPLTPPHISAVNIPKRA